SRAPRGSASCWRDPRWNATFIPRTTARGTMTTRSDSRLSGWLVIDKPEGMTSARVVALVKRATGAKVGHAGTLDPLATGVLPLALGEATKTAQFAAAGQKRYRFRVRWGIA